MLREIVLRDFPAWRGMSVEPRDPEARDDSAPGAAAVDLLARHHPLAVEKEALGQIELLSVGRDVRRAGVLAGVRVHPNPALDPEALLPGRLQHAGRLVVLVA